MDHVRQVVTASNEAIVGDATYVKNIPIPYLSVDIHGLNPTRKLVGLLGIERRNNINFIDALTRPQVKLGYNHIGIECKDGRSAIVSKVVSAEYLYITRWRSPIVNNFDYRFAINARLGINECGGAWADISSELPFSRFASVIEGVISGASSAAGRPSGPGRSSEGEHYQKSLKPADFDLLIRYPISLLRRLNPGLGDGEVVGILCTFFGFLGTVVAAVNAGATIDKVLERRWITFGATSTIVGLIAGFWLIGPR